MTIKKILVLLTIFVSLLASCKAVTIVDTKNETMTQPNRVYKSTLKPADLFSVAVSGLEDSQGVTNPKLGEHYITTDPNLYKKITNLGFNSVKIAFDWGAIDSDLTGVLDIQYLKVLSEEIQKADDNNLGVILDMHNFGRFGGEEKGLVVGSDIPISSLVKTWESLAKVFDNDTRIIAYNLMTEPQQMPVPTTPENYKTSTATKMYQDIVDGLRKNDSQKPLIVQLDNWAMAQSFTKNYGENPDPWISDPLQNIIYEAHYYLDIESDGSYANQLAGPENLDLELQKISKDLKPYLDWCNRNNLIPYIGEIGVPNTKGWAKPLEYAANLIKQNRGSLTYWAVGGWYNSPTSATPGAKTIATKITNPSLPIQLKTVSEVFN
jgi:endoglucanase